MYQIASDKISSPDVSFSTLRCVRSKTFHSWSLAGPLENDDGEDKNCFHYEACLIQSDSVSLASGIKYYEDRSNKCSSEGTKDSIDHQLWKKPFDTFVVEDIKVNRDLLSSYQ